MILFLVYMIVGAFAGLIAGLLGIGGGIIIIPCLAVLLPYEGVTTYSMHIAVATSLAITVFTSLSAVRSHLKRNTIRFDVFKPMVLSLLFGGVLGAVAASFVSGRVLQIIFGCFALVLAAKMGFGFNPKTHLAIPGRFVLSLVGLTLSTLGAFIGVSGGVFLVPFFTHCNIPIKQAVSTSAACTLPITFAGSVSFLIMGLHQAGLPHFSIGFIFLPALIGIASMSMIFAPMSARLSARLPSFILTRAFAVLLVFVSADMLFVN